MYAVIETGGKQYRVTPGQILKIEKLPVAAGEKVVFEKVLMCGENDTIAVGAPYLTNATVQAEVLSLGRHKKIRIIKLKRRKHHMKRMGHRQYFTEVQINAIDWAKKAA
jgi:large subunit ribosomal protein L21